LGRGGKELGLITRFKINTIDYLKGENREKKTLDYLDFDCSGNYNGGMFWYRTHGS
jgi:hypothetical protein